jgi:hypothetical protein
MCSREALSGGGELGWGELVAVDPGAGEVETALAVGSGKFEMPWLRTQWAKASRSWSSWGLAAAFGPLESPACAKAALQASVAWLTTELG